MRAINLIVIHCTASPNGKPLSVEAIRKEHIARGFSDIGYHWVIDVDGSVNAGRPEEQVGSHAHVEGHTYNQTSIGVALVGGLGGSNKLNPGVFSQAQWDSLQGLVQDLLSRFPGSRVVGHRDLSPDLNGDGQIEPCEWIKLCPTFEVSAWLASDMAAPEGQVA